MYMVKSMMRDVILCVLENGNF